MALFLTLFIKKRPIYFKAAMFYVLCSLPLELISLRRKFGLDKKVQMSFRIYSVVLKN